MSDANNAARAMRVARTCVLPLVATMLVAAPASLMGQPATSPPLPPVRRLSSAHVTTAFPLGAVNSVRELPGGRLLVNDGVRRRLLLVDSTLRLERVVLDSMAGRPDSYGARAGTLIPYLGDSSLFVDAAALTMIVIDGSGHIVRVRAVPRAGHALWLGSATGQFGWPGVDARGRLVYRISAATGRPAVPPPKGVPYVPASPDSAFVVAVDLASRAVDTLAAVRIAATLMDVRLLPNGEWEFVSTMSPLPLVDDWGVLPDGRVAVLRGRDYRVEWIDGTGRRTSSAKLPFPWVALTQDDKARLTDSVGARELVRDRAEFVTSMIAWSNVIGRPYPRGFSVPAGYVLPPGIPRDWKLPTGMTFPADYTFACAPGVAPSAAQGAARPAAGPSPAQQAGPSCVASTIADRFRGNARPPAPTVTLPLIYPADKLPDYRPPFAGGALRVDRDGRLWIRTQPMTPDPGGVVYDVVDGTGTLVERVQVPVGFSVAGFGSHGVVFLASRAGGEVRLSRSRVGP